jgi:hypothetical protein
MEPRDAQTGGEMPVRLDAELVEEEEPTMIQEDEEELHDLGFMIEDHDDRRTGLLEHWQRLETLDTDEALETDVAGPLPAEASLLRRAGMPADRYPGDAFVKTANAERDEQDFARTNRLAVDPGVEQTTTVARDPTLDLAPDLDQDARPEVVDLRGHAPGIATGFGSSVALDIGPRGFEVQENPLMVSAGEMKYPISTEKLSDEARGTRDVDEMGTENELARLADAGAQIEESRRRSGRRPKAGG